jgi:hypothetical protein
MGGCLEACSHTKSGHTAALWDCLSIQQPLHGKDFHGVLDESQYAYSLST